MWLLPQIKGDGYTFFLITRDDRKIEIGEPVDFDSFKPKIIRDPDYHGMDFEYAETELGFHGNAFRMVADEYRQYGVDGQMTFLSEHVPASGLSFTVGMSILSFTTRKPA